jgi:molybdopterin molybdotransferase
MSELGLRNLSVPIVGFVGYSGSGKTTLLAKVITELSALGLRIGVIKHAHHRFDVDQPGKDSYVLRHAGAIQTMVASKSRWALMTETPNLEQDPQLAELIPHLEQTQLDLILVEGFKHTHYPKLEVYRPAVNTALLYPDDPDIIALITNEKSQANFSQKIPVLDLDDTAQVVQFILDLIGKTMTEKNGQPITCMDSKYDSSILTLEQALAHIESSIQPQQSIDQVAIHRALDRVLAQEVTSPIHVPPYDNSAMDGYAIVYSDIAAGNEIRLKIVATVMAGAPHDGTIHSGQCARIMTGAKIPLGADTVIMQELVEVDGDSIVIKNNHKQGENVRRAGEDIARGDVVLQQGRKITPADMGLLASLGIPEIKVCRRIRVAFFSTGDELKPLNSVLQDGQIYDSNRYTLYGMLSHLGADVLDMGTVPDDRHATQLAFNTAAANADVLITTGGVSVGEADYVKETLEQQGDVKFWKLAIKPGKPLTFGRIDQCWFFGLPGNPVSAMVTFYQLVLPGLQKLSGQEKLVSTTVKLPCVSRLRKRPGRLDFQRGIMEKNAEGKLVVKTTGNQGSHILSSMSKANCFIVLPLECGDVEPGTDVEVQPFFGLI